MRTWHPALLTLTIPLCAGCSLAGAVAEAALPAAASTSSPTASEVAPTAAPTEPSPVASTPPAPTPQFPAPTPPPDAVELVFDRPATSQTFSVYAPKGSQAEAGDFNAYTIVAGKQRLFTVGVGADLLSIRKKEIEQLEVKGEGALLSSDEHHLIWSESKGKSPTRYFMFINTEVAPGKRIACFTAQPNPKRTDVDRALELCKTLRLKK